MTHRSWEYHPSQWAVEQVYKILEHQPLLSAQELSHMTMMDIRTIRAISRILIKEGRLARIRSTVGRRWSPLPESPMYDHPIGPLLPRDQFMADFQVEPGKWGWRNINRILRYAGLSEDHQETARCLLDDMGMKNTDFWGNRAWPPPRGVWDHGELWCRDKRPWGFTGQPYGLRVVDRDLLARLAQFPGLRVAIDDRLSYYGRKTHHVRVYVEESMYEKVVARARAAAVSASSEADHRGPDDLSSGRRVQADQDAQDQAGNGDPGTPRTHGPGTGPGDPGRPGTGLDDSGMVPDPRDRP